MREWEYRKLYLNQHSPRGDDLEVLNAAGTAGWELVGITGHNVAYLKREAGEPDRMSAVASGNAQAHGTNWGRGGSSGAGGEAPRPCHKRDVVRPQLA